MTQENVEPLQQKIIRQVEYYFGDSNLSRDNFLKDQLGKEDGWIEIKTLLTFNRLKALTEDQQTVADAIRKSTNGLIEVNEGGDKLKRIVPLPEWTDEYKTELKKRSVHLRGFPKDSTLDQITEFCSQYGTVEQVQMRRLRDKKTFKGCIFAIYKSADEAQKSVQGTEKFLSEHDLQREDKEQYFKRKQSFNIKKNKRLVDLKSEKTDEQQEEQEGEGEGEKNEDGEKPAPKYTAGCVLKLFNVPESVSYFDLKQTFLKHAKVNFVDKLENTTEALARFESNTELKKALEALKPEKVEKDETQSEGDDKAEADVKTEAVDKADGESTEEKESEQKSEVVIKDARLAVSVLSGDEEVDYWKMVEKIRSEFSKKPKPVQKGGSRGKRFKRKMGYNGGQRKKQRSDD